MKGFFKQNFIWIIFLILVSGGSFLAEQINGRLDMRDLEVYYRAADRLFGGDELYRSAEEDPWEHYVFKYAPPSAMLFIPFLFFGIPATKIIYWILLTAVLGLVLYLLRQIFSRKKGNNARIAGCLVLGILITGTHFFRELHLGQVNLLLLGIYISALALFLRSHAKAAGALLAFSVFIKPFGLIFLPLFLIMGKWKEILYFIGFALLFFLLPMLFYSEYSSYFDLYSSWFTELNIELGSKQDLFAAGNHSIFSILARYTPLGLLPLSGSGKLIYQLIILLALALLLLWFYFSRPVPERGKRIFIVLIALIPLLAYTSYNAFIFSLPLVLFLLFRFRELNTFFKVVFILSSICIGGNIYDLVGPELFDHLWANSIYSWGCIGLIVTSFSHWNKFRSWKTAIE
ncbi:MAG: glycosyltransferase family 87 protein [Bacteroidales bacterium]|nr:glycosyltransferase family 87 protein [Bacteroidales bacterium]